MGNNYAGLRAHGARLKVLKTGTIYSVGGTGEKLRAQGKNIKVKIQVRRKKIGM